MYRPIDGVFVIGVGHKARHGKDTTANHIVRETRGQARIFSFADDVYALARQLGMQGKDPVVLQALGTEVGRRIEEDRWVKSLYNNLLVKRPAIAVIPDCRFPNEIKLVKDLGGVTIKVARFNGDGTPFVATDRNPNHPSETALDSYTGWDYELHNNNLARLRDDIDEVLWDLRARIGVEF